VDCGMWSVDCGVRIVECGVWSAECELWSVNCGVWSVECVECGVWIVDMSKAATMKSDIHHMFSTPWRRTRQERHIDIPHHQKRQSECQLDLMCRQISNSPRFFDIRSADW